MFPQPYTVKIIVFNLKDWELNLSTCHKLNFQYAGAVIMKYNKPGMLTMMHRSPNF